MKNWFILAAISAALAVILGALGAHALKAFLTEAQLASFETAVRYQMYHSLAVMITVIISRQYSVSLKVTLWMFAIGTLLFSGSIYLLSTIHLHGMEGLRMLGPVTPFGGVLLITGWISMAVALLRKQ